MAASVRTRVWGGVLCGILTCGVPLSSALGALPVVEQGTAMMYIEPLQNLPNSSQPTGWTAPNYDVTQDLGKGDSKNGSSGWQRGIYGVGYGDDDDATRIKMDGSVRSVYTRTEFPVDDPSAVASMILEVDYDDGFIAWLNGVEVARSATMAGKSPLWDTASGDHEASDNIPPRYEMFSLAQYLSVLVPGRNVLAIAVWNITPSSSDLSLMPKLTLLPPAGVVTLTRRPYLQSVTPDSVTVVWDTDVASDGAVEFATTTAYGATLAGPTGVTHHEVTLQGLSPNTTYYYRVLQGGRRLTDGATLTTAPPLGDGSTPFSFVVVGDSGSGRGMQYTVAEIIRSLTPTFMLHSGDLVYPEGQAKYYDADVFTPYRSTLASLALYPVLGNADATPTNAASYPVAFHLPTNSADGSERYYSFDYGDAHFIALDTNQPFGQGSVQYTWLVNDLASTTSMWKIVYFHEPPYTSIGTSRKLAVRDALGPVFEQYGVDLVFNGHAHVYERTVPIKDFNPQGQGVTYVVTGGGGNNLDAQTTPQAFTAVLLSTYHAVKVQITGGQLLLKAIKSDGSVIDTYQMTKSIFPKAAFTATPAVGPFPLTVTFDASASTVDPAHNVVYEWTFGDGQTAMGRQVTSTYAAPGVFTVTLKITDGLLTNSTSFPVTATIPLPAATGYGNLIGVTGGDVSHVGEVNYSFSGVSGDVVLSYDAYDVDFSDEVEAWVNGVLVMTLPTTPDGKWSGVRYLVMPDRLVDDGGLNVLRFKNRYNPPGTQAWGLRSVDAVAAASFPTISLPSPSAFGNLSGIRGGDTTHPHEVLYSFSGRSGDVVLNYEVYDVDFADEVRVFVNGVPLVYPAVTADNAWSDTRSLTVPASLVNAGGYNLVSFTNSYNPPNTFQWGVRNVSVGP